MPTKSPKLKKESIHRIRKECISLEQALISEWIVEEKKKEYAKRLADLYNQLHQ
jgi:hypothetical protein